MKNIIASVLLASITLLAAPPAPPQAIMVSGTSTLPTTNSISAPVGFFPVALVYNSTNIIKPSASVTMIQWQPNTESTLLSYNLYFGDLVNTNVFPKLSIPKIVNSAVFINLNTNLVYGFYVTAYNTTAEESAPSSLVVLKPGTLAP